VKQLHPYAIFPLGDRALTVDFGNVIDENINKKVLQLFHQLQKSNFPFIIDVVPAYSSLAVYYDVLYLHQHNGKQTAFETMAELIESLPIKTDEEQNDKRLIKIPVCYSDKYALDIEGLAKGKNLSVEEVVRLHTSKIYRVYMLGFLPGFAYMGEVDERIATPRKAEPRTNIVAGSVGIAGKQTGIYPADSPGGWQIIGRTPVQLFNKQQSNPVLFQPGDEVQFYAISEDEFAHY
jgi:inhibitor of KinA